MGRPVKIFRVYYADSMGEHDLLLATLPCLPVAWAFSACSSAQPSLCFECVGWHAGLSGPRVLLPGWGRGSCGRWAPPGWSFSVYVSTSCSAVQLCVGVAVLPSGSCVSVRGACSDCGILARPGVGAPNSKHSLCIVSAPQFHLCTHRDRGRWGTGQAHKRSSAVTPHLPALPMTLHCGGKLFFPLSGHLWGRKRKPRQREIKQFAGGFTLSKQQS